MISFVLNLALLALSAVAAASPVEITARDIAPMPPDSLPFNYTYLFSAHLSLGALIQPINVTGGVLVTEPIISGVLSGPAINGTITYGVATPSILGSLDIPQIRAWGNTSDGAPFVLDGEGVGVRNTQMARFVSDEQPIDCCS
jgi:hypothetical protein